MTDATARLALPFIAPGQAQKEVFHNEALIRVDALLQAAVEAVAVNAPPASPAPGQCWLVGAAPTGAWGGQALALAAWSEGGWRFVAPVTGMTVWSKADGLTVRFDGAGWRSGEVAAERLMVRGVQVVGLQQSPIAVPGGGTTIDSQARNTLSSILVVLRNHGLIAF